MSKKKINQQKSRPEQEKQGNKKQGNNNKGYLVIALLLLIFVITSSLNFLGIIKINKIILDIAIIVTGLPLLWLLAFREGFASDVKRLKKSKLSYLLLGLSVFLLLVTRIIPYITNDVPLGYDSGIYDYAFKHYDSGIIDNDWVKVNYEPSLFLLGSFLNGLGISFSFFVPWLHLIIELINIVLVFVVVRDYFDERVAGLSVFMISASMIQFKAFAMSYEKNIMGIFLLFACLYLLKKESYTLFVICASLLAITHKPTFMIFAIAYGLYFITSWIYARAAGERDKSVSRDFIAGLAIALIVLILYFQKIIVMYNAFFAPVVSGQSISGGLFMNFLAYKSIFFINLPFLAVGIFMMFRNFRERKEVNMILLWLIANLLIVFFRVIFYNRFIVHLDFVLLIVTSFGAVVLYDLFTESKSIIKYLLVFSVVLVLLVSVYSVIMESSRARPLIGAEELEIIRSASRLESNATLMVVSSTYGPWALYSERKVVSPGLFNDKMTRDEWMDFWHTPSQDKAREYLDRYEKPLYIYVGRMAKMNREKLLDCFEVVSHTVDKKGVLYKYVC